MKFFFALRPFPPTLLLCMFDRSQLEEGGKSRGEEAAFQAKEKIFFSGERRRDLALPTYLRAFPGKKRTRGRRP